MTGCGTITTGTYPCSDIRFTSAVGALPENCPLARSTEDEPSGPPSLVLAENAMSRAHIAIAADHYANAIESGPEEPRLPWQIRALAGLGYTHSLLGRDERAARALDRLHGAAPELAVAADHAAAFVQTWHAAAIGNVTGAIEAALSGAERARKRDHLGTEALLAHQAVRLGSHEPLERLTELAEIRVCRRARLAAAHARALKERAGTGLATVASCFAAAGMPLEAIDARCHCVAVLREQGANASAWEAFGQAHQERSRCGPILTPAWLAARMPLPLTEDERNLANLTASGFTTAAIARRLTLTHDDVERTLRGVYAKLRVSDRQALATVMSTATD